MATTLVGRTLHGYFVEKLLGEGGMGAVYLGFRSDLKRRAAIKVLHDSLAKDPEQSARFVNEAITASEVRQPGYEDTHENVVRVEHVGHDDEGRAFIVYEYLDGVDLETWIANNGLAPTDFAAEVIFQVCRVLDAAHPRIVHRDLKPANVFIIRRPGRYPFVKLLDFGIAKVRADLRVTGVATGGGLGGIMGTPVYMAPEQVAAPLAVDFKADIWAVGVILYQMLSGRLPFPSEIANANGGQTPIGVSFLDLHGNKIEGKYIPLSTWRPDLGPAFDLIIGRCLAANPGARYPNVRALAQDVSAATEDGPALLDKVWPDYAAGPEDITVPNDGTILPTRQAHTSHSAGVGSRPSTLPSSKRRLWLVGPAAVVIISALVLTGLLSGRGSDDDQTDSRPANPDDRPTPTAADPTIATPDVAQPMRADVDAGTAVATPAVALPAASVPDAGAATPPEAPDGEPDAGAVVRRRPHRTPGRSGATPGASASSSTATVPPSPPPIDAGVPPKPKKVNANDLLLGR